MFSARALKEFGNMLQIYLTGTYGQVESKKSLNTDFHTNWQPVFPQMVLSMVQTVKIKTSN